MSNISNFISRILLIILVACITSCADGNSHRSVENQQDGYASSNPASSKTSLETGADVKAQDNLAFYLLTYSKFQNFVNNIDAFSIMVIDYDIRIVNANSDGLSSAQNFGISTRTQSRKPYHFSDIENYYGGLIIQDYDNFSQEMKEKTFTSNDLELIFDYLESHNSYFFNGEEFTGLDQPYITSSVKIKSDYFEFILFFFDPDCQSLQYDEGWIIHKSLPEYPAPEHPLYGLFQLLENDFIPQFEEE